MDITWRHAYRGALRFFIVALLILTGLGPPFRDSPIAARQPAGIQGLDLPALSLTPPQLAAAGMPGYELIGGERTSTYHLAYITGDWTDQITDDDIRASFESYGLRRAYESELRLRQDPADIMSDLTRDLIVSLHEFGDPSGATQALTFMDQLSAAFPEVLRVDGTGPITANAVIVRPPAEASDNDRELWVAWQVDRLVVVVRIIDYLLAEPTSQDAESIAAAFTQGIQTGLAGETPGLANRALRLKDVEFDSLFEVRRDEYLRIAGQDFSFDLEDAGDVARWVAAAGDALDAYAFNQFVQDTDALDPTLPFQFGWVTRLYRFADDQAASAWLAAQAGQIEASYAGTDDSVEGLQIIADAPTVGDESVSVAYNEQGDFPSKLYRTYLRVGNSTADVFLSSSIDDPFPATTIQALAAVQAQCLANGCPEPIQITDALAGTLPTVQPVPETPVPSGQAPVDLAILTLTPADLAAQQMPGYGIGFGQMSYPDQLIGLIVDNRGLAEGQVRPAIEGSGFLRRYDTQSYIPARQGSPIAGEVGRVVASYVLEFADESGAAAAFSFLEDESGNSLAADIPMSAPIGSQSEATTETGMDPVTGYFYDQIDLTFQTGRFQGGVSIIDWQGDLVQLADVEKLAQLLFTRLQSGQPANAAGLSGIALRMSGAPVGPYSDQYLLVAGQAIPQYGESAQEVQDRSAAAAAIAQTDEYEVQQYLAAGAEVPDDDVWYTLHLMRFADQNAATSWMAGVQGRISGSASFANVVFLPQPSVGDESIAYTLTSTDGTIGYRGIAFRIGSDVVSIDVSASGNTNPLLLLALADKQASCLRATACAEPFSVPPGMA